MRRIISLIAAFVFAAGLLTVPSVMAGENGPVTQIAGHNLSLEDRINLVYYVSSRNVPEAAEEGLLIWVDEPDVYAFGTEDYKITTSVKNGSYKLYFFNGLAAKQMTDEVKAISYIKTDGEVILSSLDTYSIAEYCNNKIDSTTVGADGVTTLGSVVKSILKYGAYSQKYLGYNLDNLAYTGEDYTISDAFVDDAGHLMIIYSNGTSVDAGKVTGENGLSAYEIAVAEGFSGSKQEWLDSLGAGGDRITSVDYDENGELTVTLANGDIRMPGEIFTENKKADLRQTEVGDYVTFGRYEQDNDLSDGQEPVEWLVLAKEEDRMLVTSRYGLDADRFDRAGATNKWIMCSLREWLNYFFLNEAFSQNERKMIMPDLSYGDKVALLSIDMAESYFLSDADRKCFPTDYAIARGVNNYSSADGCCSYWLKDAGIKDSPCFVTFTGGIGNSQWTVAGDNVAVRPVIWINIGS